MPSVAKIKTVVRERDGFCCTVCGMTDEQHREKYRKTLDVHRKAPGSVYTVDGCVTICQSCHGPQPRRKKGQRDLGNPHACQIALPVALYDALKTYAASKSDEDYTYTVAVAGRKAVRTFLEAQGLWPPPATPPKD